MPVGYSVYGMVGTHGPGGDAGCASAVDAAAECGGN